MATGARRLRAVLLEPLALRDARDGLVETGEVDVGRRRRNDLAQHVGSDLEAAPHDRGPGGLVVREQHPLRQHARAPRGVDLLVRRSGGPREAVVPGERRVGERVRRGEQRVEGARRRREQIGGEGARLALEQRRQRRIEVRVDRPVPHELRHRVDVEPLLEVIEEAPALGIGQHAPRLRLDLVRRRQLTVVGGREQRRVRHALQVDEGQAGRELVLRGFRVVARGGRAELEPVEELLRLQHREDDPFDARLEVVAAGQRFVVERPIAGRVVGGERPAVDLLAERIDEAGGAGGVLRAVRAGHEVAGAGRRLGDLLGGVEVRLRGERRHREVVAAVAKAERLGL